MRLNIHAQKMSFGHARDTLWVNVTGRCDMSAEAGCNGKAENRQGDECTVFLGGPVEAKMLADAIYGYCREQARALTERATVLAAPDGSESAVAAGGSR